MYAAVLFLTVGVVSSPAAADSETVLETLDVLLTEVVEQGREAELDGEPVFTGRDRFLPGKVALAFGWLLWAEGAPGGEAFDARLAEYRTLLESTQDGKRSINPILQVHAPYTKLAGSRLNGSRASMASTEVAAGSSLKT